MASARWEEVIVMALTEAEAKVLRDVLGAEEIKNELEDEMITRIYEVLNKVLDD